MLQSLSRKKWMVPVLFLAPALAGLLLFRVYPIFLALWESLFITSFGQAANRIFVVPDYEPNMPGVYQRYFSADRSDHHPWHGSLYVSDSVLGRIWRIIYKLPSSSPVGSDEGGPSPTPRLRAS